MQRGAFLMQRLLPGSLPSLPFVRSWVWHGGTPKHIQVTDLVRPAGRVEVSPAWGSMGGLIQGYHPETTPTASRPWKNCLPWKHQASVPGARKAGDGCSICKCSLGFLFSKVGTKSQRKYYKQLAFTIRRTECMLLKVFTFNCRFYSKA